MAASVSFSRAETAVPAASVRSSQALAMAGRHDPPTPRHRALARTDRPSPGGRAARADVSHSCCPGRTGVGADPAPLVQALCFRRPRGFWREERQFGFPDQTAGGGVFPAPEAVPLNGAKDV